MIYRVKQITTIDTMIDRISMIQGNPIDWEERTRAELSDKMSKELVETLSNNVVFKKDTDRGTVEATIKLVVYGDNEFKNKINRLKKTMQHNLLPHSAQMEILKIFKEDCKTEHKNNGKVYI